MKPGVNILLGINGSGKTSFLHALEFLFESVIGRGMYDQLSMWGGFDKIHNRSKGNDSESFKLTYILDKDVLNQYKIDQELSSDLQYEIEVFRSGTMGYRVVEELKELNGQNLISFDSGKAILRVSTTKGKGDTKLPIRSLDDFDLALRQIKDPSQYEYAAMVQNALSSMRIYHTFDVSENSDIRKPGNFPLWPYLRRDGKNLAVLLNQIKNEDIQSFVAINERLTRVNHVYTDIDFAYSSGNLALVLREKNLDMAVDSMHMSDGTLQFLLMCSIFLNKRRGKFIGGDEPERGLHPDMIVSLAEMMKEAAKNSQLVIATHSPLLLNEFSLNDVLVFEKDAETNSTIVKTLDEDDFDENALPGQLWLEGKIGGTRW